MQIVKGKIKLQLFVNDFMYKIPSWLHKKIKNWYIQQRIGYKVNIQKSAAFWHTNNKFDEIDIEKSHP